MDWNITFISKEDFKKHVAETINSYGDKLKPYDLEKFNSNLIDPIKMVFDKAVYNADWQTIVSNEIFRQRDKSQNNAIGYFHQYFFKYIDGCTVPKNGEQGGWDIIYENKKGINIDDDNKVYTIYVEMKNKHNTMNSSSSVKTYTKMQSALLENDSCACFLVEAIAKKSQNIPWKVTIDHKKVSHKKIRRVSLDQFLKLVTGVDDAFYQICMALPEIVDEVIQDKAITMQVPKDVVYEQLLAASQNYNGDNAMYMALYILAFDGYLGFSKLKNS